MILLTSLASKPSWAVCLDSGAQCAVPVIVWYSVWFQPLSYSISSLPHLMTPTFTGRSTVLMLLALFLLPGTYARSGMKAPKGTPMNRLFSTSQTEHSCSACAAIGAASVAAAARPTATSAFLMLFIIDPLLDVGLLCCCFFGACTPMPARKPLVASACQLGLYSPGQSVSPTFSVRPEASCDFSCAAIRWLSSPSAAIVSISAAASR